MTETVDTPQEDSGWNDRALRLWRDTFALIPADEWRPDEVELLRQLRNLVIALNRNLKLPSMSDLNEEDEGDSFELFDVNSPDRKMTRSESGRKAAHARWAKHRDGGNARRA